MSPIVLYTVYSAAALGAAGVYLCLPKPEPAARRLPIAGLILGLAALAALMSLSHRWIGAKFEGRAFFIIFASLAVVAAVRVVTHTKPVYSALYFILVVLSVTGLCVLASAEFLGIALVIVYAGAILVTYVFVIMLAQQAHTAGYDLRAREPFAAVALGFLLVAATSQAMLSQNNTRLSETRRHTGVRLAAAGSSLTRETTSETGSNLEALANEKKVGNVQAVGGVLMTTFVVSVEIAGVLLLVAMVGAIAIAQKRIDPSALTTQERDEMTETDAELHRFGREALPF